MREVISSTDSHSELNTSSLMRPHKKKSSGVRSGDLGGNAWVQKRDIKRLSNNSFNQLLTIFELCAGLVETTFFDDERAAILQVIATV